MLRSVSCIHLDDVYRMIAILGSLDHCIKLSTTSMLLDSCHQRYKNIRRKIDVFSINFSPVLIYVHVYLHKTIAKNIQVIYLNSFIHVRDIARNLICDYMYVDKWHKYVLNTDLSLLFFFTKILHKIIYVEIKCFIYIFSFQTGYVVKKLFIRV